MSQEKEPAPKGRRVTIDLTPGAAKEVDRIRDLTGLTTADIFRHAMSLFRIYVDARKRGDDFYIIDSEEGAKTRLEVPIPLA
jgi:hypothetical protein